jgi:hypothetical protein
MDYKGSQKHILDLTDSKDFVSKMNGILKPFNASISGKETIQPKGYEDTSEIGLQTFIIRNNLAKQFPSLADCDFNEWWKPCGGKAPTWDLISLCQINGKEGILLVEAKAHRSELAKYGKAEMHDNSSKGSIANHGSIKCRIKEANDSLKINSNGFNVSTCTHYQLSNRVAFAWKLKQLGVPVVLLYLGFTGDDYFKDKFKDESHWKELFDKYIEGIIPVEFINSNASEFLFIESALNV